MDSERRINNPDDDQLVPHSTGPLLGQTCTWSILGYVATFPEKHEVQVGVTLECSSEHQMAWDDRELFQISPQLGKVII